MASDDEGRQTGTDAELALSDRSHRQVRFLATHRLRTDCCNPQFI